MLSPHEFATLMLVKDARHESDFDQADLRALLDKQLIELVSVTAASALPRMTDRGRALLARLYACACEKRQSALTTAAYPW